MAEVPAKLTESILPAIADIKGFAETFAENCEGIVPSFDTITIPGGGGLSFSIVNEDTGDAEAASELVGVIIDHHPARAYWPGVFAGGTPPDCSSQDAITGTKYGECKRCQYSKYGSEIKQDGSPGKGQACKFMRRVFMLMSGQQSVFPKVLVLPPTSAGAPPGETAKGYEGSFSTYTVKQAGRMKKLAEIQTRVKLIPDKSTDNIKYSKTTFFPAGDISDEDKAKIRAIKAGLGAAMRSKPIEAAAGNGAGKDKEPWDE